MVVAPLDHYAMGWHAQDVQNWPSNMNLETTLPAATADALLREDGIHQLFYMKNGFLGAFEVASSQDGMVWEAEPQPVYFEEGAHNPSFDYDAVGNLWMYYNLWSDDCPHSMR